MWRTSEAIVPAPRGGRPWRCSGNPPRDCGAKFPARGGSAGTGDGFLLIDPAQIDCAKRVLTLRSFATILNK
jgi:hypothetical protein